MYSVTVVAGLGTNIPFVPAFPPDATPCLKEKRCQVCWTPEARLKFTELAASTDVDLGVHATVRLEEREHGRFEGWEYGDVETAVCWLKGQQRIKATTNQRGPPYWIAGAVPSSLVELCLTMNMGTLVPSLLSNQTCGKISGHSLRKTPMACLLRGELARIEALQDSCPPCLELSLFLRQCQIVLDNRAGSGEAGHRHKGLRLLGSPASHIEGADEVLGETLQAFAGVRVHIQFVLDLE
jgi:hypothetical protein